MAFLACFFLESAGSSLWLPPPLQRRDCVSRNRDSQFSALASRMLAASRIASQQCLPILAVQRG